jgi:hypothetical protein
VAATRKFFEGKAIARGFVSLTLSLKYIFLHVCKCIEFAESFHYKLELRLLTR